jgi:hypothetical protein
MSTILAYRKDGPSPYCDMVIDSGERVLISLDSEGISIERLIGPGMQRSLLLRASSETIAWICATLQQGRRGELTQPLDVLMSLAIELASGERIHAALNTAAAAGKASASKRSRRPAWLRWR